MGKRIEHPHLTKDGKIFILVLKTLQGVFMDQGTGKKGPNTIKHVIGVMSGKGGVGKSSVCYLLSVALKLRGYKVGVLDADLTGSSMPRLFNLKRGDIKTDGDFLIPFETQQGIKLVSMNLILEDETQPLIWRAPLLNQAVMQFWEQVVWGDLDFLVVDLPPGTADIVLTVMQKIPLSGLVVVTTPHDMVSMVVSKSITMARALQIPILGVVENMSSIICPHCGKPIELMENDASLADMIVLAKIPMIRQIANISSRGLDVSDETIEAILTSLVDNTIKRLEEVKA